MDLIKLKTEVQGDPAGVGYAAYLTEAPGYVADMLNRANYKMAKSKWMSFRGLYTKAGVGPSMAPSILGKIRAGAESDQVLFDAKQMIYSDEGMDFGGESTLMLIAAMTPVVFTEQEASALLAISQQPASRAEVLFGAGVHVTEEDVRKAIHVNV